MADEPSDDLHRAARTIALLARTLERAAGDLSLPQYRVLALVAAGDERATHLAGRLAITKPSVSAVVDGLVERGYLAREPVADDRRAVRLCVTKAGAARKPSSPNMAMIWASARPSTSTICWRESNSWV